MNDAWGEIVTGTKVVETPRVSGTPGVTTLNMGLIKKKRKAGAAEEKK